MGKFPSFLPFTLTHALDDPAKRITNQPYQGQKATWHGEAVQLAVVLLCMASTFFEQLAFHALP